MGFYDCTAKAYEFIESKYDIPANFKEKSAHMKK